MSDAFRTATTPTPSAEAPRVANDKVTIPGASVEPPFTDYEKEKSKPFTVEYYQLGDTWKDPDGGFYKEVSLIEDYFKEQIKSGEIANTVSAVKSRIKEIEKVIHLNNEERPIMKISLTAAYLKFLTESNQIKSNIRHYGH